MIENQNKVVRRIRARIGRRSATTTHTEIHPLPVFDWLYVS